MLIFKAQNIQAIAPSTPHAITSVIRSILQLLTGRGSTIPRSPLGYIPSTYNCNYCGPDLRALLSDRDPLTNNIRPFPQQAARLQSWLPCEVALLTDLPLLQTSCWSRPWLFSLRSPSPQPGGRRSSLEAFSPSLTGMCLSPKTFSPC